MSVLYEAPGPRAKRFARIVSVVVVVLLVAAVAWLIVTLALPRTTAAGSVQVGLFDPSRWDILRDLAVWRRLGTALAGTLSMAGVAAVFAIVIGVLFSFGRTARSAFIRLPVTIVLEFFRGMPVLLMMLFILLVFAAQAYWAGVWALAVYNGALIGEILRSGVAALPRGQREAGLAIGLSPLGTRLLVEFPQAVRNMLPIIIAQLVVLLKDTALAYIIGYQELLNTVRSLSNFFGNQYFFTLFFVVLVIYLTLNLLLSWVARIVAKRTGPGAGKPRIPRRGVHPEGDIDTSKVPDAGMGSGGVGTGPSH
ncbi:MAG: amino acid ABC transporter permease [Pseudolysinimonas sp.]|uniref:amino acid ABC transporter permease n=1 Tax=Pseudolysinimonas sp. TaxID=2680009 RepID=UPI003C778A00